MKLLKIKSKTLHIYEEMIEVNDVSSFKDFIRVLHYVDSSSAEINSYINDKKALNTKTDIKQDNLFFNNAKKYILSNKLGNKAVKTALALAISTGLSISANASQNQNNFQTHTKIEQKQNIAKKYVLENIQKSLISGMEKAKLYNKEKGFVDKSIDESITNSINVYARIIDLEMPVNAEVHMDKKEINIYLSKQALNDITTIEQSKEILKMVENMTLHEYQHALSYLNNIAPLEKYAVEAQQKYASDIDYTVFPKTIIDRDNKYLKELFSNQIKSIKNKIENSSLEKDDKAKFNEMINLFEKKYNKKLEKMNSSNIFGKREVNLSNVVPGEYLSTTMKHKDFENLTKNLSETEKFVLSRQSAIISHLMPVELGKENYNHKDVKKLVSLAVETEEKYKENVNLLKSEKSIFNDTLIEDFKNTNSSYYKWLEKELNKNSQEQEINKLIKNKEMINLSDNQIDNLRLSEVKAVNLMTKNNMEVNSLKDIKKFLDVVKTTKEISLKQDLDFDPLLNRALEKMNSKKQEQGIERK